MKTPFISYFLNIFAFSGHYIFHHDIFCQLIEHFTLITHFLFFCLLIFVFTTKGICINSSVFVLFLTSCFKSTAFNSFRLLLSWEKLEVLNQTMTTSKRVCVVCVCVRVCVVVQVQSSGLFCFYYTSSNIVFSPHQLGPFFHLSVCLSFCLSTMFFVQKKEKIVKGT